MASSEPLDDQLNLGLLCYIAHRAMEDRVFEVLEASGFDDITPAQARVFARLGPHGTRLTDLADQARVTKQSAGFLVDQLERAGYVRRLPDPTDARARLVVMTPRGRRVVAAARRVEAQVEAEWTRHLGARRTQALRDALSRLREITDPYR